VNIFKRWTHDLRKQLSKGDWKSDFKGESDSSDTAYAFFIAIVSLVPAMIVAHFSRGPQWKAMATLFGAPLQAVISGFLTSSLIFLGSHLNRVPQPFSVAYKLMLRIMAVHPLLVFFAIHPLGPPLALLVYGGFVIRGVCKTYPIPLRNAMLFFGLIYFAFAMMQLQTTFRS
jgi:hypothetical protein